MRLSAWAIVAPEPAALSIHVRTVLGPVLATIGGEADPHCLPLWGQNPAERYTLLSIALTGLVVSVIRVDVPAEGPRVAARLVRWTRLQMGELAIETTNGRRILTMTLENQVLRAADEEANRVGWFVRAVQAADSGRPLPPGDGSGGIVFVAEDEAIRSFPAPRALDHEVGSEDR